MSLDLPSIREAIGGVLDAIPDLVKVDRYEPLQAATNNIPYASIRLGPFQRVEPEPFGAYTYQVQWRVNVILATSQTNAEIDAQKLHQSLAAQLFAGINADSTLDPNGPGIVDQAILEAGDPPSQPTDEGVWSCQFTITTIVTTT